ncbi:MAG: phosphoribosylglycinamide formyltransferase [Ketobacteraceae bacterium]|nr:phosphoribosylglycinamide formyltransferase [Ketobacteraceae bacterium]
MKEPMTGGKQDPCMVVLISGSGTNLQAIIDANEKGAIPGRIAAVISNRPDAGGLRRAGKHGVPGLVIDHRAFNSREAFDEQVMAAIDAFNPRLVVLAGFMRILTEAFVNHYEGRLINIHPSLLPLFKGLNTHQRAIEAGESEHGCSTHFVTYELDGGPVIGQRRVPVLESDTPESLASRVQKEEHILYPLTCKLIMEGRLTLEYNRPTLDGQPVPATGIDFTGIRDWTSY